MRKQDKSNGRDKATGISPAPKLSKKMREALKDVESLIEDSGLRRRDRNRYRHVWAVVERDYGPQTPIWISRRKRIKSVGLEKVFSALARQHSHTGTVARNASSIARDCAGRQRLLKRAIRHTKDAISALKCARRCALEAKRLSGATKLQ
jgi:hypothetical protein